MLLWVTKNQGFSDAIAALGHISAQPHPGQQGKRGVPILYSEVKARLSLLLTPTSIKKLGEYAIQAGVSRSEFIEQFLRELPPITPEKAKKKP
jgi:hypothetical protein